MRNYNPFAGPTMTPGQPLSMPVTYFEDFIGGYTAVDLALAAESDPTGLFSPVADRGVWLLSFDTLVADSQLFAPQDDADGGWVKATTDATAGERINAQINGEMFKLEEGRTLYFEIRCKFSALTADAVLGIGENTTDPHADAPASYVAFTLSGDSDIEAAIGSGTGAGAINAPPSGGTVTDTTKDIVADTFVVLGFEYDGKDTVSWFVNGAKTVSTTSNVPKGKFMSPIMCIESNGAAEALTVDYIMVVNQRV